MKKILLAGILLLIMGSSLPATEISDWFSLTRNAEWKGRTGFASVTYNANVYVIGGYDGTNYLNDVWRSSNGYTWISVTQNAEFTGAENIVSLFYDSKFWVIGGNNGSNLKEVWNTTDGVTWTNITKAAEFTASEYYDGIIFNDKMYLVGGNSSSEVWESTDGEIWTGTTLNAEFTNVTNVGGKLASFNNKVYWLDPSTSNDKIWYSSDMAFWVTSTASAGWANVYWQGFGAFDSKLWTIGGRVLSSQSKNVYQSSDGITWTRDLDFDIACYDMQLEVINDTLVLLGGADQNNNRFNQVWIAVQTDQTETPTITPTTFYTHTFTCTYTTTPTYTPTISPTNTPITTSTYTVTPTNTPVLTKTNTPTNSPTPTISYTHTYTSTATPTFTISQTSTYTLTVTPTPTFTASLTITPTPSITSTITPVETISIRYLSTNTEGHRTSGRVEWLKYPGNTEYTLYWTYIGESVTRTSFIRLYNSQDLSIDDRVFTYDIPNLGFGDSYSVSVNARGGNTGFIRWSNSITIIGGGTATPTPEWTE